MADAKAGERLLLNSYEGWFSANDGNLEMEPALSTSPTMGSNEFHLESVLQGDRPGKVEMELDRPTFTQSVPGCVAPQPHQCHVTHVEDYTVVSTGGSGPESAGGVYVEVDDSAGNMLAWTVEGSGTTGPPPLTRDQAIALTVACVDGFS